MKISEHDFKKMLDTSWSAVTGIMDKDEADYRDLAAVSAAFLLAVFGVDKDMPVPGRQAAVLDGLKQCLCGVYTTYPSGGFPEDAYAGLLGYMTGTCGAVLPWAGDGQADSVIGGAYCDSDGLEPGSRSAEALCGGGFCRYDVEFAIKGSIRVWAREPEQAETIVECLAADELKAYGTFGTASVGGVYDAE